MQKTKIVQKIIGEAIKLYGFEYTGFNADSWIYRKQVGELKQDILISLIYKGELKIYFRTNAYGQKPIYGETLVKEGEDCGDALGFYSFADESEFTRIIEYFKKIIFDYGFEALERNSVPTTEIRPTEKICMYLYENHKELNKEYRDRFNINDDTSHEKIFEIIQDYMIETQGQPFAEVIDTLIGIAAVVGTVYVDISKGGLEWDPDKKICWVTNKEKHPKKVHPLNDIMICWREKPGHSFAILNNYYNWLKG